MGPIVLSTSTARVANPASTNTGSAAANRPGTRQGVPTLPAAPALPLVTAGPGSATPVQSPSVANPGAAPAREPQALNEFQRFVALSTGQTLARLGDKLFDNAGSAGFDALERTPVPASYAVGPGDELHVRAWGSVEMDEQVVVDRNGQISLPRVGTMGVAGLKAGELEAYVRGHVQRTFVNFSLSVSLGQVRGIQVYAVGQARRPGSYTVSGLSTLVNAVFATGGPGGNGSMRQIELRRDGQLLSTLDLYDFIVNGNKARDLRLQSGDVIVYRPVGPQVALLGALDQPAVYELKPGGEPLQAVLAYGGGVRAATNPLTVQLERIDATTVLQAPRSVSRLDLQAAVGTPLRDGDLVTLFGVPPQFANAVTLRGNVAAPLRYPYTPGMRVSDLIPERAALMTPDYYMRKNKLVQFSARQDASVGGVAQDLRSLADEPNWEYAVIERLDPDTLQQRLLPFHLGKAVIDRDPRHDQALQPGDVVTVFKRGDMRAPIHRQSRLVRVEGEVGAPGIYQVEAGETLHQLLARAGGLTEQAYLFGLSLSRVSTRQAQAEALAEATQRLQAQLANQAATRTANLGGGDTQSLAVLQAAQQELRNAQLERLRTLKPSGRISLELDPQIRDAAELPELPLEDGDQITVPNRPGFVFAVGAVDNGNALVWRDGRPVKAYLDRAGLQPEADEPNIFVLRADGSVSRGQRGWFGGSVQDLALMPGDTLVVPDKVGRETFWTGLMRGLKDWSQILYQFGLSAAAIHTLNN